MSRNALRSVFTMGMLLAVSAADVFAQSEPLRPPTTKAPPSSPKFIVLGVAVLLTGLVVFVATLKSKRGHQD
jgi:hypothetical protein